MAMDIGLLSIMLTQLQVFETNQAEVASDYKKSAGVECPCTSLPLPPNWARRQRSCCIKRCASSSLREEA